MGNECLGVDIIGELLRYLLNKVVFKVVDMSMSFIGGKLVSR